MTPAELGKTMRYLGVTQADAARLLEMTPRSVNRWFRHGVPRPIETTMLAWVGLKSAGLPWRPRALPLETFRDIGTIIEAVNDRGGPAAPWAVDAARQDAALGPILITFLVGERLPFGFRPISYERSDARPDLDRDRVLIQDGIYRIAAELQQQQ